MFLRRLTILLAMLLLLCFAAGMISAAVMVSGTDEQVRASTIAVAPDGQNIVIFWESTQFQSANEHLRYNRSTDGGIRWRRQVREFEFNTVNHWFSDYLPDAQFDKNGILHVLWSFRDDHTSPRYTQTPNLGDTWSTPTNLGGGTLPRFEGLALCVGEDPANLWAIYHDYNWHAYVSNSSDSGKNWAWEDTKSGCNPLTSFCSSAVQVNGNYYVARIRNNRPEILTIQQEIISSFVPDSSDAISMAENHAIAADAEGRVYVVYSDAGKLVLLRSEEPDKSFSVSTLDTGPDMLLPVIAVTQSGKIAIAWEQNGKVMYAVSEDGGERFSEAKPIAPASEPQSAPDICTAGESLFFSFTQNTQVWFAGVPNVPSEVSEKPSTENLLPNPSFEDFADKAPTGWSAASWNQEFLNERFGKGRPGRDGSGYCLEMKPGNGASAIAFTGSKIALEPDMTYVFKGYYASTCERLEVSGKWLDNFGESISSFSIVLPDTQDRWIEFFEELSSPIGTASLQLSIHKKWQTGRARFDDFSLRAGMLQDYEPEFSLPAIKPGERRYPIFGWCTPGTWSDSNTYPLHLYNSEKAFAEYALANFTVGAKAKYGTLRQPSVGSAKNLPSDYAYDDSIIWLHGGDEPAATAFPALAEISERLREIAPNKPFLVNLLPTYGFASYKLYEEYLDGFIEAVKPTFFTYDHYALSGPNNTYSKDFFANLELVRDRALKNGADWGIILLVTAHGGLRSPTEAELRWQAFNSLAYGSAAIGWFTYLTEVEYGGWNWRDSAINWDGTRSAHYSMLKFLNAEILNIGNILLGLKSDGVYHTKPLPDLTTDISRSKLIKQILRGRWTVGEFSDASGTKYVLIANRDYSRAQTSNVFFTERLGGVSEFDPVTGKWHKSIDFNTSTGAYRMSVPKGEMKFLRLEK